ncbi:MAG TPA: site-specific integrase [Myxococcaceae bacterium]|nr:site-specific integrase [Myxococcaceae bacterium]
MFGNTRLDKIFAPEVEAYKARKLREKLSAKTVNNHLAVLRKLLNLAVEWGELSHAPRIRQLRVPLKDFQFLTCDESERFLEAADSSWRTMLTVALKTGVRLGELLALKWEDVDLRSGKVVVRRTLWQKQEGTPKGGRSREIPLSEVAKACLQRQRHLKGPYVFCKSDGSRFSHSEVKGVVRLTCQRAGLAKRLTWHHLRHSFASHLVMRGVPLKSVQELMGHASIEMTMRYAHLSPHVNRSAVDLLDLPVQDRRTYGGHGA